MSHHDHLQTELEDLLGRFRASPPMARLLGKQLGVEHYAAYLRQNVHVLRERPVLMARAAARFADHPEVAKRLHKRAVEEIYHDRQALTDLADMGRACADGDPAPLPETLALLGFGHYVLQRMNPVGLLGSLYVHDFLPLHGSGEVTEVLLGMGVPAEALSVLQDSQDVGPLHQEAMGVYVDELVDSRGDLDAVVQGMRTTVALIVNMIAAAFAEVDAAAS